MLAQIPTSSTLPPPHSLLRSLSGHQNLLQLHSSNSWWELVSKSCCLDPERGDHIKVKVLHCSPRGNMSQLPTLHDLLWEFIFDFLSFLVSLPHFSTNVSWKHLPKKPLMLTSLFQSLLLGLPKLGKEVKTAEPEALLSSCFRLWEEGEFPRNPLEIPLTAYWSKWLTWTPSAVGRLEKWL